MIITTMWHLYGIVNTWRISAKVYGISVYQSCYFSVGLAFFSKQRASGVFNFTILTQKRFFKRLPKILSNDQQSFSRLSMKNDFGINVPLVSVPPPLTSSINCIFIKTELNKSVSWAGMFSLPIDYPCGFVHVQFSWPHWSCPVSFSQLWSVFSIKRSDLG